MGGWYRVWTRIQVNDYPYADSTTKHLHRHKPEDLLVEFCQNWAGDDWFITMRFRGKSSGRIVLPNYYEAFNKYNKIVNRLVKEFCYGGKYAVGKPCSFAAIEKVIKASGMTHREWQVIPR